MGKKNQPAGTPRTTEAAVPVDGQHADQGAASTTESNAKPAAGSRLKQEGAAAAAAGSGSDTSSRPQTGSSSAYRGETPPGQRLLASGGWGAPSRGSSRPSESRGSDRPSGYVYFPGPRLFPSVQGVAVAADVPSMLDIEHACHQVTKEGLPVFFGLPLLPAIIFSPWGEKAGPAAAEKSEEKTASSQEAKAAEAVEPVAQAGRVGSVGKELPAVKPAKAEGHVIHEMEEEGDLAPLKEHAAPSRGQPNVPSLKMSQLADHEHHSAGTTPPSTYRSHLSDAIEGAGVKLTRCASLPRAGAISGSKRRKRELGHHASAILTQFFSPCTLLSQGQGG